MLKPRVPGCHGNHIKLRSPLQERIKLIQAFSYERNGGIMRAIIPTVISLGVTQHFNQCPLKLSDYTREERFHKRSSIT